MASANFRKAYYSSLGVQVVEVKPSVETALLGDILDIERLNKLCLWVRIPHAYRPLVWKVLLGTISLAKEVWPFVDEQRTAQFTELWRCVRVLRRQRPDGGAAGGDRHDAKDDHDDDGQTLTAETMVRMLLVQTDARRRGLANLISARALPVSLAHLTAVANAMLEVCDTSETDAFWLFESFVRRYGVALPNASSSSSHAAAGSSKSSSSSEADRIAAEINAMQNLLSTHSAPLLKHILSFGQGLDVYCYDWFRTYFASVLPPHCLEGVWDIFIGGAPGILSYLGLSVLLACRRKIEGVRSAADLARMFAQVERWVDMDAVANTAIDLWERPVLEGMTKDTRKALGYNF